MKIVVLTTETPHHTYFVRELVKCFPVERVVVERAVRRPSFDTAASFEKDHDQHELRAFFDGSPTRLSDVAATLDVESADEDAAVRALAAIRPDVAIVFGTGKLSPAVIRTCPAGMVNLHGGDPEEYRGLDTHLWAIYHRDFGGLVTTLHRVNQELDDGDIVLRAEIPLRRGMPLYELRHRNTEVCIQLAASALEMYARHGAFLSRPQRRCGRYYSFMPAVLKEVCRERFEAYTSKLA